MSRATGLTRAIEIQPIDVIVGIVSDPADRILIGQRPDGKHMAGSWEFPGGKLKQGESPVEGLRRELEEEVGIRVETAEPLIEQRYRYPERDVRLDVWWVLSYSGQVHPRESQALRWVSVEDLAGVGLLPADAPIVAAIRDRLIRRPA